MAISLGDRVRDKISGLKGIVIGVTEWLYGCRRMTIQPEEAKDGKPADAFTVDEPQLGLVDRAVIIPPHKQASEAAIPMAPAAETTRSHGPRPDAPRSLAVTR